MVADAKGLTDLLERRETGNAEKDKLVFQVAHHPVFRSGLPTLEEGGQRTTISLNGTWDIEGR